jgi:class 3 adenylate cyclase/streptogramin lyase
MRTRRNTRLATVLFTDIVGSTEIAAELGDRRWKVLVGRHHRLVRRELRRFGGRELDTAGDGFFAAFGDQSAAIRCACAIAVGVYELGLEVRCGLNVGSGEVVDSKVGGLMVVTASRIMALAAPSEVLVSRVLRDLVPGAGFTFEDRGIADLKGIEGEAHLFAVTGIEGVPRPPPPSPEVAREIRRSVEPPPFPRRRGGRIAITSALVVVAALVGWMASKSEPEQIEVREDSVLRLDPATGQFVADIPVDSLGSPPAQVPPTREIWMTGKDNQVISIISPGSDRRTPLGGIAISTAEAEGYGVAYLDGSVWVTGDRDQLFRISPETHLVSAPIQLHGGINLLAAGEGHIWASAHNAQRVLGIDPSTDQVDVRGEIGTGSNGIAVGAGSVWVANYSSGTVSRIDPRTGRSHEIPVGVERTSGAGGYLAPGGPSSFAFGFGSVWITDPQYGVVYRLDPDTEMIDATIRVGEESSNYVSGVAVAAGAVWITSPASKTIVRIDPAADEVSLRIPLPHTPQDLLEAYGSLWVTIAA